MATAGAPCTCEEETWTKGLHAIRFKHTALGHWGYAFSHPLLGQAGQASPSPAYFFHKASKGLVLVQTLEGLLSFGFREDGWGKPWIYFQSC